MSDKQDKINLLLEKLDMLLKRQDNFSKEINILRIEINNLRSAETKRTQKKEPLITKDIDSKPRKKTLAKLEESEFPITQPSVTKTPETTPLPKLKVPKIKLDLEKFIGENLINKIGIVITIIGVSIGAKYSIENDLISPLTRIILGYLFGIGLLGFGIKLKAKYESYSAVLVSGAMAIMYFLTFAAYSFYGLFPQIVAFGLMVFFTIFTVLASINYNRQIIALIGLVGAYAVPFLLSNNSGSAVTLFCYMTIINIGILFIAIKKYWKILYYIGCGLTWLIFLSWLMTGYKTNENFGLALTFLGIFFAIFYATFLAYKLIQKENFVNGDAILLLFNSFVFYGLGYGILTEHETGNQLLGLFTLGNGIIHFIVASIIYKQKLANKNLLHVVLGLVLIFITIAIPVQLDGNWVTLLWAGEAALLFWIGRTKGVSIFEVLSYPLMLLACFSLVQDWSNVYSILDINNATSSITPLLNIHFLSSIFVIGAFVFINFVNNNKNYPIISVAQKEYSKIISFAIPAVLLALTYFAFFMEISNYWDQQYAASVITSTPEGQAYSNYIRNEDYTNFKTVWLINYSLLFVSLLSFLNFKKLKSQELGVINIILNTLAIGIFLVAGLIR